MKNRICCIDRIPLESRGVSTVSKLWENGSVLKVRFIGGTRQMHQQVKATAKKWSEYANIHFDFSNSMDAVIRVSFDKNKGSWSYVGQDALRISKQKATMNLGWLKERVILHEFGHAIGLGHEHQNPVSGIQWNKEAVYEDMSGPPNYWDKARVDNNYFNKYNEDLIQATRVDPDSIMMYPIPQEWTINNFSTDFNSTLSEMDKAFIATLYPYDNAPVVAKEQNKIREYQGKIANPGDEHEYHFIIQQESNCLIETSGSTDIFMVLYGPEDPKKLVVADDDSGSGRNSKIQRTLPAGTYFLKVRHYNRRSGRGSYSLRIETTTRENVFASVKKENYRL